jgi:hypothetical protein
MNAQPQRATLTKAPLPAATTDDVVGQVVAAATPPAAPPTAAPARRGPGRPRTKVRYENLSTKISIDLRDRLDEELDRARGTEDEVTVIQAIDEALTAWLDIRETRRRLR